MPSSEKLLTVSAKFAKCFRRSRGATCLNPSGSNDPPPILTALRTVGRGGYFNVQIKLSCHPYSQTQHITNSYNIKSEDIEAFHPMPTERGELTG